MRWQPLESTDDDDSGTLVVFITKTRKCWLLVALNFWQQSCSWCNLCFDATISKAPCPLIDVAKQVPRWSHWWSQEILRAPRDLDTSWKRDFSFFFQFSLSLSTISSISWISKHHSAWKLDCRFAWDRPFAAMGISQTKLAQPRHPYYPTDITFTSYVPNTLHFSTLLYGFGAAVIVLFVLTYIITKWRRSNISTSDILKVQWFVLCKFYPSGCAYFWVND